MGSCCSCETVQESAPAGEWAKLGIAGVVAAQSMIFGLAVNLSPPSGTARSILHGALAVSALVVFVLAGGAVVRNSWEALKRGRIVFDQLFLLGIAAAYGASLHCTFTGTGHVYYEIVAILLAIHTFGRLLTESRRNEVFQAAGEFGKEFSVCERLTCCGETRQVPVDSLEPGDRILAKAGGPVCVDGVVESGTSFVQEAALTGEPFPVVKRPGDRVLAGSHTLDGDLTILADGPKRTLDQLLAALEEARLRPSRLQREADKLASWFLPVVLVIATLTFAFWTWRAGWMEGLFNALAVILVACPCAMGIATPAAIWNALAALARSGLITRDPDIVEKLAQVRTVVFDKTGTLGEEAMELVDFVAADNFDRNLLRSQAAALEAASNHPVARAFRAYHQSRHTASNVHVLAGAGIEGLIGGRVFRIGNAGIFDIAARSEARKLLPESTANLPGTHEVFVSVDGQPAGAALLREVLRPGARESVQALEALGLKCRVMTGDRPEAAERHGLPGLEAGLSAAQKCERVRALEESGEAVLFVGDGINDSAAMQEATAAIALRHGTPLAREAAGAEMPGSGIAGLPEILMRSRGAVRTIRENLLFAASYNCVGITLAALGFLHPVAASLIMLASSFTVTWRALREAPSPKLRPAAAPAEKPVVPKPRLLPAVAALCILLQGPVIAWLGQFPLAASLGIVALFSVAALGIYFLLNYRRMNWETTNLALMFSVGGLAMLVAWWADAGFAQVVRDGVCLCNCPKSTMGLGLFARIGWMDAAMVAVSLPMLMVPTGSGRWVCWVAGVAGMILGMEAASLLTANFPTTHPQLNFFAGYGAMLFGMVLGMVLACRLARKFLK